MVRTRRSPMAAERAVAELPIACRRNVPPTVGAIDHRVDEIVRMLQFCAPTAPPAGISGV